jgi:hypothetical protein
MTAPPASRRMEFPALTIVPALSRLKGQSGQYHTLERVRDFN